MFSVQTTLQDASFGGDVNFIPDVEEKKFYTGLSGTLGLSSNPGFEGHFKAGTTLQPYEKINLFTMFDYYYARILEW